MRRCPFLRGMMRPAPAAAASIGDVMLELLAMGGPMDKFADDVFVGMGILIEPGPARDPGRGAYGPG